MNNKILIRIFIALVIFYAASKIWGGNKEKSFDSNIISIDSETIDKIVVTQTDQTFTLQHNGDVWKLEDGSSTYTATASSVQTLLDNLSDVTAQRIVAKSSDKWANYEVGDTDPRIELYSGNKKLLDIRAGRFSFDQVNRSGTSFVRLEGEDEVYAINGFSSMTLRQKAENYRNKSLIAFTPSNIQRINVNGNSLTKTDGQWMNAANEQVDSTEMANYLSTISNTSGSSFSGVSTQNLPSAFESVQFDDGTRQMEVRAYADTSANNDFYIQTSENTEGIFASDSTGVYDRIFGKLYEILNK